MTSDVWQSVIVEDMLIILIGGITLFLFILHAFPEIHCHSLTGWNQDPSL